MNRRQVFVSRFVELIPRRWRQRVQADTPGVFRFLNIIRKLIEGRFEPSLLGHYKALNRSTQSPTPEAPPALSIVVPIYNTDRGMLSELIASISEQTDSHWECILVDDCSTDTATLEVLESIKQDRRFKVIRNKTNIHIAEATNRGVEVAAHPYILFVDHDDILATHAIQSFRQAIAENPGVGFFYSDNAMIDSSGRVIDLCRKPSWQPETLLSTCYCTHARVIRADLIRSVGGFNAAYNGAQDIDMILKLTERGTRVGHISDILYFWRITPASVTSGVGAKPYIITNSVLSYNDYLARNGIHARSVYPKIFEEMKTGAFKLEFEVDSRLSVAAVLLIDHDDADRTQFPSLDTSGDRVKWFTWSGNGRPKSLDGSELERSEFDSVIFVKSGLKLEQPNVIREFLGYLQLNKSIDFVCGKVVDNKNRVVASAKAYDDFGHEEEIGLGLSLNAPGIGLTNLLVSNVDRCNPLFFATRASACDWDIEGYSVYEKIFAWMDRARVSSHRLVYNPWAVACATALEAGLT